MDESNSKNPNPVKTYNPKRLDPREETVHVGLRMTHPQREALRRVAKECGMTFSALMRVMAEEIVIQRSINATGPAIKADTDDRS